MSDQQYDTKHYIPISLGPLQEMMGGVPRGAITTLVGAPGVGKSTLAMQLAAEVGAADSGNVVIFDTEQNFHTFLILKDAFTTRFGEEIHPILVRPRVTRSKDSIDVEWEFEDNEKPKKDVVNVFVIYCPDLMPILAVHGRAAKLDFSENSGKAKITPIHGGYSQEIEDAPFFQFAKKHNVKIIVYDSITNPLEDIPPNQENLQARADATQFWLIQAQKIAFELGIPIIAVTHETRNEANPFGQDAKMEGGKGIAYLTKYTLYIMKNEPKLNSLTPKGAPKVTPLGSGERYIWGVRLPGQPDWKHYFKAEIGATGFTPMKA